MALSHNDDQIQMTSQSSRSRDPGRNDVGPREAVLNQIISATQAGNSDEISKYRKSDVLKAKDPDGSTALHIAVIAGYDDVVKALFKVITSHDPESSGGSSSCFDFLHARTRKGHTAIHLAVLSRHETILKLLIENYRENNYRPNNEWDFADQYWMTPLHYAVLGNQTAHMEQLLEWPGYDRHVNAGDYFKRTPLHLASCHRPVRVEALLQHTMVDVNAKDCLSLTPLHWAVYFGRVDVVRCLVEVPSGSAIIHAVDRDVQGRSVLEIAMEDSLLDLIPGVVSDNLPCAPFQHDKLFLRDETPIIHQKVNAEIVKLLLTCTDVDKEKDDLDKNLVIYVNAINAILVAATLIAGASIGMLDDFFDATELNFWYYIFFFFKMLSFYGSIGTVLAGVTILRPLAKSIQIVRRVQHARSSLRTISWMLGFSVWFFVAAFYTENATRVSQNEFAFKLRIPYHVASVVAIVLLCIFLLFYFLRLHKHMKSILSDIEISIESVKVWWEVFLIKVILPLLFFLERFCFVTLGLRMSDMILEHYVKSYRWTRRRKLVFDEAENLYTNYCASRGCQSQDMDETSELSFSEISKQIRTAYSNAWNSWKFTRVKKNRERESGQRDNRELKNSKVENLSFDCGHYWQRHGVSPHDQAWFKRIEMEILWTDRAYRRLTTKTGEIRSHYTCFLDRLPLGLLFWIQDWVNLWKKKFPIFYRGYIFERDYRIFEKVSHHIRSLQETLLERKRAFSVV